jgi:ABC-type branched-subunit amino acid transport system substrate-binding protein
MLDRPGGHWARSICFTCRYIVTSLSGGAERHPSGTVHVTLSPFLRPVTAVAYCHLSLKSLRFWRGASACHANGRSEELIDRAIAGQRDRVFLVSKVDRATDIAGACEASLSRLSTSYLDLYLLHWPMPGADLSAVVAAFEVLRAGGKIRAWGVSNFKVSDMEDLFRVPDGHRCATNQVLYNLSSRGIERDLLPWCEQRGMPVMAYSPLGSSSLVHDATLARATKKMGWKTAYVLLDTFIEYDKSECRGFVARFKELNGDKSVVLEDTFKNADVSVAAQISRYSALPEKPQIMVVCSVPPGLASAIRQFRSAGVNIPVLSATGGDGSAWHSAVPGLTNYYYLNYSADAGVEEPRPDARGFDEKYQKQFGERPGSGQGITGHSVVQGWARAAERAKSLDTAAVRAELEKFTDEPLLAGLTTFTPKLHTNLNRPMLMIEIKDTKPSPLGYYDMRKGDYVKWW